MNHGQGEQQTSGSSGEIQAGYYNAHGIEGSDQLGFSGEGNEQVSIELTLTDLNRTVTTFLSFTDAAMPYSLERLRALGWKGGTTFAGIGTNPVQVEIKYEQFNGKRSMKVNITTNGGGRFVMKNQMAEPQKLAFFNKVNAAANAPKAQAGKDYPQDWDTGGGPAQQRPAQQQQQTQQASGGGAPPRVKF